MAHSKFADTVRLGHANFQAYRLGEVTGAVARYQIRLLQIAAAAWFVWYSISNEFEPKLGMQISIIWILTTYIGIPMLVGYIQLRGFISRAFYEHCLEDAFTITKVFIGLEVTVVAGVLSGYPYFIDDPERPFLYLRPADIAVPLSYFDYTLSLPTTLIEHLPSQIFVDIMSTCFILSICWAMVAIHFLLGVVSRMEYEKGPWGRA